MFQGLHLVVTAKDITQTCHVLMVLDSVRENQCPVISALLLRKLEIYGVMFGSLYEFAIKLKILFPIQSLATAG